MKIKLENEEPLVSIVLPIYNAEKFIEKCVCSLLGQTYRNFEVIAIDDGSVDESVVILKKILDNTSLLPNFKLISQENRGVASARNLGISLAEGQFIGFLDSDDYYDADFIERAVESLLRHNSDVCITGFKMVREDGSIIEVRNSGGDEVITGFDAFLNALESRTINSLSQNKLFKKNLFDKVSYPENLYFEDTATIFKLMYFSERVSFVKLPLFNYVQRKGSTMNGYNLKRVNDKFKVLELNRAFLKEIDCDLKCENSYINGYLLNAVLSTAVQISINSTDFNNDMSIFASKIDKGIFSLRNIFRLFKLGLFKKGLALVVLKYSWLLFKYFSIRQKSNYFI